jgi:hypothetical protein
MAAIRANPTDRPTSASAPTSRWEAPGLDGAVRIARERGGEEQATATQFQGLRGSRWGAPGGASVLPDKMPGAIPNTGSFGFSSSDSPSPDFGFGASAMPPIGTPKYGYGATSGGSAGARFGNAPDSPYSAGGAWQSGALGTPSALAAKRETAADRWAGFGKTMLDQGSSGSRGTPTAPGASARVALRREARRSPYPEDQQFGRRIGGFRDRQSNSWAP